MATALKIESWNLFCFEADCYNIDFKPQLAPKISNFITQKRPNKKLLAMRIDPMNLSAVQQDKYLDSILIALAFFKILLYLNARVSKIVRIVNDRLMTMLGNYDARYSTLTWQQN